MSVSRIWLNRPGQARIEACRDVGTGIEPVQVASPAICIRDLTVIDGPRRWDRYSDGRVETDECEARPEMTSADGFLDITIDRHFNPERIRCFLEFLTLEPMGRVQTADRDCVSIRALPRPSDGLWPHWLPYRADEYELHFDLALGVLLNIIGRFKGDLLGQHEVIEVAFDEPLDARLFAYELAPGDQVQPKAPFYIELSRDEAISRMPFQVLFPASLHELDYRRSAIEYHRPRRPGDQSYVSISYYSRSGFRYFWVNESAGPHAKLDDYEWERLSYGGTAQREIRISDSGDAEGMRIIAFQQSGTYVTVYSDIDRTKLVEIALSFKAATDDPTSWPDEDRGDSHRYPF
jgi:hypothetical protein